MDTKTELEQHKKMYDYFMNLSNEELSEYRDMYKLETKYAEAIDEETTDFYCNIATWRRDKKHGVAEGDYFDYKEDEDICRYCPAGDFSGEHIDCLNGKYDKLSYYLKNQEFDNFRESCAEIKTMHTK